MRVVTSIVIYLLLVNLTGIPNMLVYALDDRASYMSMLDEEQRETESAEKEKEDKDEKEDIKESFLAACMVITGFDHGLNLEARNTLFAESVFYPEDHSPPPEAA